MTKPKIRIVDTQFGHASSFGCDGLDIHPTHFDWHRGNSRIGDVVVVTENCFNQIDNLFEHKVVVSVRKRVRHLQFFVQIA